MELTKYGITLRRLREQDIEIVRQWRNSEQISQFMEFRGFITPEMQQEWFLSVNNTENFYYIINYKDSDIGLINSSKIDWNSVSSDGGIFLWDEQYYETFVPVWASLCLLETSFFILGATSSTIKTLRNNARARQLNTHLGYVLQPGQEDVANQVYIMTADSFRKHAPRLIKAATLLAGSDPEGHRAFFDTEDLMTGLADFIHQKIIPETILRISETREGRTYIFKPTAV